MNRLKGTTTYLCGAIDNAKDGGESWRNELTPWLKEKGIYVMDPCKKPIDIGIEDEHARADMQRMKEEGRFDEIRPKYRIIRNVDLRMTDLSHYIIVYIDLDISMAGTLDEIVSANKSKKPILIVCKQGKKALNNWYFFMLPHEEFFNSFDELKEYLTYIDGGGKPYSQNRWFFFDYDKMRN